MGLGAVFAYFFYASHVLGVFYFYEAYSGAILEVFGVLLYFSVPWAVADFFYLVFDLHDLG